MIRVEGTCIERVNMNEKRPTGHIEIACDTLVVLNKSKTPPFLIQDETDASEVTRMQYRYLDIRRNPMKEALVLRNRVTTMVRPPAAAHPAPTRIPHR